MFLFHINLISIIFFLSFPSFVYASNEWLHSSGNFEAQRHSHLKQITKQNISELKKAWIFFSGKVDNRNVVQATPIFIDNKLIIVDIFGGVYALNPENGEIIWQKKFKPPVGRRGITSQKTNNSKIYISSKKSVLELDAKTGRTLNKFESGLSLLPPIIVNKKIYIATLKEGVKAFDIETAKEIWNYKLNKTNVNPRIWSGFSYDRITDSLFIVTSNPGGLYGGKRSEDNLSVSLISLNRKTGKKKWHFQHIRNDLWDLDLVGNPIIFSRKNDTNKLERVVVALSKTGDVIFLNAKNGSLIFPNGIEKINVPISDVKNEKSVPFQYKFTKPTPFSNIKVDLQKDFNHLTKSDNIKLFKIISNAKSGNYLPPSFNYNLIMYGLHGGAEWPGGSLNKEENSLIIPFNREPWVIRMEYKDLIFTKIQKISQELWKLIHKVNQVHNNVLDFLTLANNPNEKVINKITSITNPWENNYKYNNISKILYSMVPYSGSNEFYINKCSSCHGIGREGFYENEFKGDRYIPSLVGLHYKTKYKTKLSNKFLKKIHNDLNINFDFDHKEVSKTLSGFKKYDEFLYKNNLLGINGFWQNLLDVEGYPASAPPWGGIAKLDMNSGDLLWKIPFGYRLNKNDKLIAHGDKNFGGVLSTSSNIFFATGTPDEMARAYSSQNGDLIWESKLPFAGSAPPMSFLYKGCQYIIFTATGGQFLGFNNKGDATVAYKLSSCN